MARKEAVAARPVGEQVQLLLLDPVLHLAALAVHILIELLRIAGDVDHEESWVVALVGALGLDGVPWGGHLTFEIGTVSSPTRIGL